MIGSICPLPRLKFRAHFRDREMRAVEKPALTLLVCLHGGLSKPMLGSTLTVRAVAGDRLKVGGGRVGWIEPANVVAAATADVHFTDLIRRNSDDSAALLGRGRLRFDLGDKERAIADLDACLRIAPNSEALAIRGFAWKRQENQEKAMADFDEAIRLDPQNALAWRVRGATWASRGDYAKAVAEYSESIRRDPENPESLHHRAVMLAACEEDPIRNGKQSVVDATRACELTEWQEAHFLNGLVMAYAERGDFNTKWGSKSA